MCNDMRMSPAKDTPVGTYPTSIQVTCGDLSEQTRDFVWDLLTVHASPTLHGL